MAQKVSASVAEALKVDLHIRDSRCGTFDGIHKAFSSLISQKLCFVCGQGAVLPFLPRYTAWPVAGVRQEIVTPTLNDEHQPHGLSTASFPLLSTPDH